MRLSTRNIPNYLSLSRIPIAAAFLLTFDPDDMRRFWAAIALLSIAIATDILDGRIARAFGLTSRTGYFLDGIGDKVAYAAILMVIFREDREQGLLPWLLIAREIMLYAIRAITSSDEAALMRLRPLSLIYAFLIRLYFLAFFVRAGLHLYGISGDYLGWYTPIGYFAAAFGYAYFFLVARQEARQA